MPSFLKKPPFFFAFDFHFDVLDFLDLKTVLSGAEWCALWWR